MFGDEADALSDMGADEEAEYYEAFLAGEVSCSEEFTPAFRREKALREEADSMEPAYDNARRAAVGSMISCPICGKQIKKTAYNKVFCRSKGRGNCKDRFHNVTSEKKPPHWR